MTKTSQRRLTPFASASYCKRILKIVGERMDVRRVPFTDRGSRLLLLRENDELTMRLAERNRTLGIPGDSHLLPAIARRLRPIDAEGTIIPFDVDAQPHLLRLLTPRGDFRICFSREDAITVAMPERGAGIEFEVAGGHRPNASGGFFEAGRFLSYRANGTLRPTISTSRDGTLSVSLMADSDRPALALAVQAVPLELPAPEPDREMGGAERRWSDWFGHVPLVQGQHEGPYYYAWWLMAANLVSPRGYLRREGMVPSKTKYVGVWHWDALFHALAYRHADLDLAKTQFRLLLDHQQEDGMLADVIHEEGLIVNDRNQGGCPVTKPPLMAWAAMKLYASGAGRDFLVEIYEPLVRWTEWWFTTANDSDGDDVPQYNHVWSSGLDDSPLWDHGMPVESPDLSTYLTVQMESLAEMAWLLGRKDEAAGWQERASALSHRLLGHFWDQQAASAGHNTITSALAWPLRSTCCPYGQGR